MKSSIHIRPITIGSEGHNQRTRELNYVRADLTPNNSSFILDSIANTRASIEQRYKESTGQRIQAKATPIREGVLLVDNHHTSDDIKKLGHRLEREFGIKTVQGYVHKDEGHWNKETQEWKPNYHAHMIFDWTDNKGKSIKLGREDMARMQTIVAEELGLERGQTSTKKHIESRAFKAQKIEEEIQNQERKLGLVKGLDLSIEAIKKFEVRQLGGLMINKTATIEGLKNYSVNVIVNSAKIVDEANRAKEEAAKKADMGRNHFEMVRNNMKKLQSQLEEKINPLIDKNEPLSKADMLEIKMETARTVLKLNHEWGSEQSQKVAELKRAMEKERLNEILKDRSKDKGWDMSR